MADFVKVATLAEIKEGMGKVVEIEGTPIAIFNVRGKFYAMDNTCAHRGGPLGDGILDDNIVTCPWHGWQWDVMSGKSSFNPNVTLRTYAVEIDGTDIKISLT